jgi:MFS family permease
MVAILTFGPRSTMGLIFKPLITDTGWPHTAFATAIAIQHIVWGVAQPIGGAIADRFGTVRVLCGGSILYAAGLALMGNAGSQTDLYGAGVLLGFGFAGASFNIVLGAFGKLLSDSWRSFGIGLAGAAGSLGQFLFSPLCVVAIDAIGWRGTVLAYSGLVLLVVPLAFVFVSGSPAQRADSAPAQPVLKVFRGALKSPSFAMLLVTFFGSGMHLAFVNAHLPIHLQDWKLDATMAGWVIATIGLFNVFGSIGAGWLCAHYPQRFVLLAICLLRAISIALFLILPVTPASALTFGAMMGLLWLSAGPPVMGLVAALFGTRNLAALFGLAFLVHQIGAFLGVWAGGLIYQHTGSYGIMWWCVAAMGLIGAAVSLSISEPRATPRS